ncbi:2-oxoadipate dehydrogenase complex component E1-like isoform X2 [Tubulanus polymorphus]|uniref:2-oxoadipate dehydrogenase complex component E1-like isoform X2 n=1 Tax=Tubulanus polymorphus TaxID=672921 RepID=UPI003DA21AF6
MFRHQVQLTNKIIKCASKVAGRRCLRSYHSDEGVFGFKNDKSARSVSNLESSNTDNVNVDLIDNAHVIRLVQAYREYGHKKAKIDPLGIMKSQPAPELKPELYGLSVQSPASFNVKGILHSELTNATCAELVNELENIYCGVIGAEFQHLIEMDERTWFAERFENLHSVPILAERKVELAKLMLKCEGFDHFLASKFTTVKRYGGEGAESMMAVFDEVFASAAEMGVKDIVACMPHRGRNNLLTCMLDFPIAVMLRKMKGLSEFPPGVKGAGDVLSHLHTSINLKYGEKDVHVSLIPNPSHLEANNPVAVGKTRSRQKRLHDGDYNNDTDVHLGDKALCLQVHGDASFTGQGIVPETFTLAYTPHFRIGGSIHLIVNNQLGFTTEPERGRSFHYCSDVGKMIACPVLHVNADYPENVLRATRLAMEYRQTFKKDVIIDLVCFRRWGHNELDDPSFTQPLMYEVINNRPSIPALYSEKIVHENLCDGEELQSYVKDWQEQLNNEIKKMDNYTPKANHLEAQWKGLVQAPNTISRWDTGVPTDLLKYVGAKSVAVPDDVTVHPTLIKTHIERRVQRLESGTELDWATGEALAMGSLLHQGYGVRISGQDVGRGTFSHRHCMLVDQKKDQIYVPLNHMHDKQSAFIEVANSALSEEAVLGFEYGLSIDDPNTLAIWEAQFGDFFNGAQPIIDTYVTAGENKWLLQSGLVMLLPNGMDGAGPEHSSCRLERFLVMCDSKEDGVDGDDVNIQIVNPTTSAQYFHLLRRQMIRNFRKPLIVSSPKMILRMSAASSSLTDMAPGTSFQPVIDDMSVQPAKVSRIIICCGKHFYALQKERAARNIEDTAIIRIEELCPFPAEAAKNIINKYPNATEFVWSQEEHRNMGAWFFVKPRFENIVGIRLKYVGRDVLGMPAVGIGHVHKQEAEYAVQKPFERS